MDDGIDVLMITHRRAAYTRLALGRLLDTAPEDVRVWIWQNGSDPETLQVAEGFRQHPRCHRFHHSPENQKLTAPTNWRWESAQGAYLSKVDDDCLVPEDWTSKLRRMHDDNSRFGVIGCWRFEEEDFVPEVARPKIIEYAGGHSLLVNFWVEGSGYLMKRACLDQQGLLRPGQTFSDYCINLARNGWVNGWAYPFLYQEHMDDPRAEHTALKTDADLHEHMPLTAANWRIETLSDWRDLIHQHALEVQKAPIARGYWSKWRRDLRRLGRRVASRLAGRGTTR
jgi:glycosyltransferase involved in cell wall biosynthesis